MSRFTCFSWGKIWFEDSSPCKRFDIFWKKRSIVHGFTIKATIWKFLFDQRKGTMSIWPVSKVWDGHAILIEIDHLLALYNSRRNLYLWGSKEKQRDHDSHGATDPVARRFDKNWKILRRIDLAFGSSPFRIFTEDIYQYACCEHLSK